MWNMGLQGRLCLPFLITSGFKLLAVCVPGQGAGVGWYLLLLFTLQRLSGKIVSGKKSSLSSLTFQAIPP